MLTEVDDHEDVDGQEKDHEHSNDDCSNLPFKDLRVFSSFRDEQRLSLFFNHDCLGFLRHQIIIYQILSDHRYGYESRLSKISGASLSRVQDSRSPSHWASSSPIT